MRGLSAGRHTASWCRRSRPLRLGADARLGPVDPNRCRDPLLHVTMVASQTGRLRPLRSSLDCGHEVRPLALPRPLNQARRASGPYGQAQAEQIAPRAWMTHRSIDFGPPGANRLGVSESPTPAAWRRICIQKRRALRAIRALGSPDPGVGQFIHRTRAAGLRDGGIGRLLGFPPTTAPESVRRALNRWE
jgi:hypothetical protein